MRTFRSLAFASTAATLLLVAIGGLVRATKSGLGCGTDWPHCSGTLVPELQQRAQIIEFSHRAVAGIVVALLGALAVIAVARFRNDRKVMWASLAAFGLVMFQAVLGAVVVKLELHAASVVLHLATALGLVAVLVYLSGGLLSVSDFRSDRSLSRRSSFAAGAVLVLLLVGSYVSGSGAGQAFPDWPLMNGRVIPDLAVETQAIHFLHRALAAVVGAIVFVLAWRVIKRKDEFPHAARLAHVAFGLFAVEVAVGAANVWTQLNAAFVTIHLAVGALIWVCLVAMAVITHPAREAESRSRLAPPRAVLES